MANVSDKVDFTLSFIGTPTSDDDGVQCKHGPPECLGNILELCAASIYPDPKIYLGFAMCLTDRYDEVPQRELVMDCSLEHGIDFDRLNECVSRDDGSYGIELLRQSVNRTADAGVTKSCTVRLNYQIRTIRDGGKWKDYEGGHDPDELISDIKKMYQASDEDWVPRRVPQPANFKASKSKTAKAHKSTKTPTSYGKELKDENLPIGAEEVASTGPGLVETINTDLTIESLALLDSATNSEAPTITTPSSSGFMTSTIDGLTVTTSSTGTSTSEASETVATVA
ncbi:MAG: hypothetical protein M1821_000879 [Bathelium mastoideum]|nr:MAG: hypothetical protein M1821_000879 [Bathelium mastoideum]KAI9694099.1 MAG: hypothetical protein M1822_003370 [Bathelium mastoideum]